MKSRRSSKKHVRRLNVETLCRRDLMAGDMTNPVNSLDVNNDSNVTASDALMIVNYMGRQQVAAEGESAPVTGFVDVNGDGNVTAGDALRVVNAIGEGETGMPNLRVERIDLTRGANDSVTEISAVISNEFPTMAPIASSVAFRVEIQVFDSNDQEVGAGNGFFSSFALPGMQSVTVRDVRLNSPITVQGSYRAVVSVDTQNNVAESNEDDNVFSQAFPVGQGTNPPLPVVSISGSGSVVEGNQVTFTATRTGDVSSSLVVPYTLSGSATQADFSNLAGDTLSLGNTSFTFPAGQSTLNLTATAAQDGLAEGQETLTVSLGSSSSFASTANTASVSIRDAGEDGGRMNIAGVSFRPGSSPVLTANVNNARVVVTTNAPGTLTFTAGGQSETITIRQDLRINATGSNNVIVFNGAIIPDDLIIDVEGGNNGVQLINTQIGDDFIYRGGGGSDGVIIDNNTLIRDDAIIKVEKGDDFVVIQGAQIGDDLLVYGDDGNDTLAVDGVRVGDDAIIRMGKGNDVGSVQNAAVHDVADVDGGRGADSLAADPNSLTARRIRQDDFEAQGSLLSTQALIDQLFAAVGSSGLV